jgi:dTDP-L-rhamnose 4-epimerase
VSDIVQANRLALTAPGAAGQVINVGSGRGTTVRALAEGLTARLRPGAPWRHVPARAEEIRHSVADLTRARSVLGYAPTTDIDAQIDGVIASVRGSS